MANTPDPLRLTPAQAAELLGAEVRVSIPSTWIEADIQAGAPTNPDGTLNLVVYCAWLLKREAEA